MSRQHAKAKGNAQKNCSLPFRTLTFAAEDGPESLFQRVDMVLRHDPHVKLATKIGGERFAELSKELKAQGIKTPCIVELQTYEPGRFVIRTATVRVDTGKWVAASFEVNTSAGAWYVALGLHATIVDIGPLRTQHRVSDRKTAPANEYLFVQKVNAELLQRDFKTSATKNNMLHFCGRCGGCVQRAAWEVVTTTRASNSSRSQRSSAQEKVGITTWTQPVMRLLAALGRWSFSKSRFAHAGFQAGQLAELQVIFGEHQGSHRVHILSGNEHGIRVQHESDGYIETVTGKNLAKGKLKLTKHTTCFSDERLHASTTSALSDVLHELHTLRGRCPGCEDCAMGVTDILEAIEQTCAICPEDSQSDECIGGCRLIQLDKLHRLLESRYTVRDECIAVNQIYFTHDSIASRFRHGDHVNDELQELVQDLQSRRTLLGTLCLNVVFYHGKWCSLSNRRLWCVQEYQRLNPGKEFKVPVKVYPLAAGVLFENGLEVVHKFFSSNTTEGDGLLVKHRNIPPCQGMLPTNSGAQDSTRTVPSDAVASCHGECVTLSRANPIQAIPHTGSVKAAISSASLVEASATDTLWDSAPLAPSVTEAETWNSDTIVLQNMDENGDDVVHTTLSPRPRLAQHSSPDTMSVNSHGKIKGFEKWLELLTLQQYLPEAVQWCDDMGAISISEIEENWEEFADALNLKRLERKRLEKRVVSQRHAIVGNKSLAGGSEKSDEQPAES